MRCKGVIFLNVLPNFFKNKIVLFRYLRWTFFYILKLSQRKYINRTMRVSKNELFSPVVTNTNEY